MSRRFSRIARGPGPKFAYAMGNSPKKRERWEPRVLTHCAGSMRDAKVIAQRYRKEYDCTAVGTGPTCIAAKQDAKRKTRACRGLAKPKKRAASSRGKRTKTWYCATQPYGGQKCALTKSAANRFDRRSPLRKVSAVRNPSKPDRR